MENPLSSWLLLSILFFTGIYILSYWVIFARRWPRGTFQRYRASSCCMSIVHGPLTSLAAMAYLICMDKGAHPKQYASWFDSHLGAPNTPFQEALMEFSTAYFLIDLLHYLLFVPNHPLFVLHHILAASYMLSCRFYTKHGAFSTIVLFIAGECTSFLQNLWALSSLTENKSLFNALNVPFLLLFTVFRGFLMPLATWKLCAYYIFSADASSEVPFWIAVYWMCSLLVGMTGSLYWVAKLWTKLIMSCKASSKKRVREPPKAEPYEKQRKSLTALMVPKDKDVYDSRKTLHFGKSRLKMFRYKKGSEIPFLLLNRLKT